MFRKKFTIKILSNKKKKKDIYVYISMEKGNDDEDYRIKNC